MNMFYVYSDVDSYFGGIVVASCENDAKSIAWKYYTSKFRPCANEFPDEIGTSPDGTDELGWKNYHENEQELKIKLLGDKIFCDSLDLYRAVRSRLP